jgi:hypothetical protein
VARSGISDPHPTATSQKEAASAQAQRLRTRRSIRPSDVMKT